MIQSDSFRRDSFRRAPEGEYEEGALAIHESRHVLGPGGVAAEQAMLAEQPQVAGVRDGFGGRLGRFVLDDFYVVCWHVLREFVKHLL